jgi:hypothetical protein
MKMWHENENNENGNQWRNENNEKKWRHLMAYRGGMAMKAAWLKYQ